MALVLKDRVKETTATAGTGVITLSGASTGFQSFAVIGDTNTTYYTIAAQVGNEWEVGIGTYTSSGTTLTRTTVLSNSSGTEPSALSFSAGTKDVFVTYPSGKSVNLDASANVTALGTPVSATLTNATGLPISTGVSGLGTGVATFLGTPSSANLAAAVTGETGTGALVFANSPTLVTPALGTPASGVVTNLTGTASININGTVGATTPAAGTFTTLTANGNTTLGDASADTVTINGTVQPGVVISGSSTGDALRITQTGTGNALVVEDSANPDGSPFVIDASGSVIAGGTVALSTATDNGSLAAKISVTGGSTSSFAALGANSTTARFTASLALKRTRGTESAPTTLLSGDYIGRLDFQGHDGTSFVDAAIIYAAVDGTPGTGDMPSRLVFGTTADGASSPTERVRITSAGKTGFATAAPAATVHVAGDTILSNVNVIGASYDSVSFSVAGEELTAHSVFFSPDGLKMYVSGTTGDDVNEYSLSTAWVVSSAVFVTNFSVASQDATPQGLFFRADGTKMYVVGATNDAVFQYSLSTPWSVATAAFESISFSVAAQETTPTGLFFKPNGLSMYVVGSTTDAVYQYTLSTAWNVSTATFLQSFSVSGQELTPSDLSFTVDGSRMFVLGTTGDDVNVYNLTTPWNISTAAFVGVFSVSGQDTSPVGIYIKPDGTKMYIVGSTNDAVFQYTVPSIDIQLTGPTSAAALDVQQDLNVYGNTTGSFLNNGFRENIGGEYYNLVSQTDIGTTPNQIPLNQYLGEMAYMNAEAVVIQPQATAVPNGIGDMVFQLTSDTSLEVKVKGSDGVVRSVTLTLA